MINIRETVRKALIEATEISDAEMHTLTVNLTNVLRNKIEVNRAFKRFEHLVPELEKLTRFLARPG